MTRLQRRWPSAALVVLPVLVVATLAAGLAVSQQRARQGVTDRFVARSQLSSSFVSIWVRQQLEREQRVAQSSLATNPASFTSVVGGFGYAAAVLLDSRGRLLASVPPSPAMVGKPIAAKYPHLTSAERGVPAVSPVVPSAVRHEPVIGFAVPVPTGHGRLVFSGAYRVTDTPLAAYLDNMTPLHDARLYLVDDRQMIVASNGAQPTTLTPLGRRDPNVARAALPGRTKGVYDAGGRSYFFTRTPIDGTGWTLLVAVPTSQIYASVNGANHWVPWLILLGLAMLAVMVAFLAARLLRHREQLETVSRTDHLTGLANRRHASEHLARAIAGADRHGTPLSVLLVDVDKFKRLNDTYGHSVGDVALRHVADTLRAASRGEDLLARWGGEEFLLVLPHTDIDAAVTSADRLRQAVAGAPLPLGGELVALTVSIGAAEYHGELPEVFTHRADLALYAAKHAGRNTVRAAAAPMESLRTT